MITTKQPVQKHHVTIGKLPELICILGAIYLAANNLHGWGWLLVVAVLV